MKLELLALSYRKSALNPMNSPYFSWLNHHFHLAFEKPWAPWEASAALPSLRLGQRRRQQSPAAGHSPGARRRGSGGHRGRQRAAARRAAPRHRGGHGGLPVAQLRCSGR